MDERRGRPGKVGGAGLRVLGQDRLDAEYARAGPPSHQLGLFLGFLHQGFDLLAIESPGHPS